MPLISIRNLLNSQIGVHKNQDFRRHSLLVAEWPEVVGPDISRNTAVVGIKGGVVKVSVVSATWATELSAIKQELILKINGVLGESKDSVIDIVFYVDSMDSGIKNQPETVSNIESRAHRVPLSDQERATLNESVSCIRNEQLRDLAIKVTALDLEAKKGASSGD